MRISRIATTKFISVAPEDNLDKAMLLMEEHGIRHLPVVESGRPLGMVSDRDLLLAVGWKLTLDRAVDGSPGMIAGPRTVKEIMSRPALYLDVDASLHTAARMMAAGSFHAVPVMSGRTIYGILTSTDIMRAAVTEFGTHPSLLKPATHRMRVGVKTVGPRDTLYDASRIMRENDIHHLPVISDEIIIGILSDRDIRRACGEDLIEDERAEGAGHIYIGATMVLEIMTRGVVTLDPDASMKEAITIFTRKKFGCLPIAKEKRLLGIVTETDALRQVAELDDVTTVA